MLRLVEGGDKGRVQRKKREVKKKKTGPGWGIRTRLNSWIEAEKRFVATRMDSARTEVRAAYVVGPLLMFIDVPHRDTLLPSSPSVRKYEGIA